MVDRKGRFVAGTKACDRRVFASTRDMAGTFDGATVDAERYVWSALVLGGCI
ncbi:hypothetical protein BGLT_00829 [Caballeronia glathei]|jgi:sugar lactone lactonase YvrE|uniref:SMP-30/gluconolactonase/LRE family protein n=1 Tax=Caballeronia glathei TaxID=60547 RepID=UPI000503F43B|nr:SMP-30/gluconolactonase/LRE family protein [Caballeronia glathei]CDY77678.1 hypothetical protein BGLT_00829 [Caballeronia glathei]